MERKVGLRDLRISTYLSKSTGKLTTLPPQKIGLEGDASVLDDLVDPVLGKLNVPVVECFRNIKTKDITSVVSKFHTSAGGFVSTKRRKIEGGRGPDGTTNYTHSNLTLDRDAFCYRHKFRLAQHRDAQPRLLSAIPNNSRQFNTVGDTDAQHPLHADDVIDDSPAVVPAYERIPRKRTNARKEKKLKRSDEELLKDTLNLYKRRVAMLSDHTTVNPHLRVYHFFRNRRTFAYATAFTKSERGKKAVFSVLWQVQTNPRKAVCVTFSLPHPEGRVTATCTCCHLITQTKGSEASCYHAQACFADHDFIDHVALEIRRRQTLTACDSLP